MSTSPADRIRAMIAAATASGTLDLHEVYVTTLVRCGIGREEATILLATNDDPVQRILYFAGEAHNFAVLAVEEALAAAA